MTLSAPQALDTFDLKMDIPAGGDTSDDPVWTRTSLLAFLQLIADVLAHRICRGRAKQSMQVQLVYHSHLVVFGPRDFNLCSCLQLLRYV